jgi:dipeptidyl aminopeptidase/acylaminoacyl peptidase
MSTDKRPITVEDLYNIALVEDPRISPDGRWIAWVKVTHDRMENSEQRNIWLSSTDGGNPIQMTYGNKDSQPRWSPDGNYLAFTSARKEKPQIYILRTAEPGGEARQLTTMTYGATTPVWSPDGTRVAFLARVNADERAKEDAGEKEEPPEDKFEAEQREARRKHDEEQRFDPRVAWRIPYRMLNYYLDDRYAHIYIIPTDPDAEDATPQRLTDGDLDHDEPVWTHDGAHIITSHSLHPEADEPWLYTAIVRIGVEDKRVEVLTDEDHLDTTPRLSPDGRWIAYARAPREKLSRAIMRLSVIPSEGGEPRDLNLDFDCSMTDFRWSPDSESLVFSASSWGNVEIYRVPVVGDPQVEKLIPGRAEVQNLDISSTGDIAFNASTPEHPPELYWQPTGADAPQQLTEINKKFLDEVVVQPTHEMRFAGPDGTEIQGWYILPVGYEEGKQYPLAFNIHGGPHVMWSDSTKSMWHEWQFHAARGYVVFYCNPHGSDGYGEDFMGSTFENWGEGDFGDLMAGIDTLLQKGFVDAEHMAITGGSYGGFMTAWVIGHTDRFAAAVSQRGVYNLMSFHGTSDIPMFIKQEFGVEPWEDPELLWRYSPLAYAHNITTPLLIIHSENDFRAPIPDAEQLFTIVRRNGQTVEFVRFPRDGHELSRSGELRHRIERLTRMVEWFDRYCKPEQ